MIFTNIWELLIDMRIYGSDEILCADIPPTYGWVCQKTEKEWRISLRDASSSLRLCDAKSIKMLTEAFNSAAARQNITKFLDALPFLERWNRLRVFW